VSSDGWHLRRLSADDRDAMAEIFNHYVDHSFAAYPDEHLSAEAMAGWIEQCGEHPTFAARDDHDQLIGFGFLRPYSALATFAATAQVTYFIAPGHTRHGIGAALLAAMENGARQHGITSILAHVSSENPGSLAFHRRHGFVECGRFHSVGVKKGRPFDVVWLQKTLSSCSTR
jgi:L-amino acid N-acyltransferase YncA